MGGEVSWMISGSAAAPLWLLEFFHGIGLPLLEAYGITENPVPVAANRRNMFRLGSVGRPFALNDVRISPDGEVIVKGPAMFSGYLGEGMPAACLTADGYYRTGDIGRFDADGFLYLTGRLNEIVKTSTGRRVSLAAVEGVYRRSPYIDQIVIVGANRPYLVALIGTNNDAASATLRTAPERTGGALLDLVEQELASLGAALPAHEQLGAFALLPGPLSVEAGELTANLKPRRDAIAARHAPVIDAMYGGHDIPAGRRCGRRASPAIP
jgi:long-chain acyl-CoA synthetase